MNATELQLNKANVHKLLCAKNPDAALLYLYITAGNDFETLPIRIYGMTKKTVTPKMYALATIIFFVTMTLLLISNFVDNEDQRRLRELKKKKHLPSK